MQSASCQAVLLHFEVLPGFSEDVAALSLTVACGRAAKRDEADGTGSAASARLLSTLLVEMDGIESAQGASAEVPSPGEEFQIIS